VAVGDAPAGRQAAALSTALAAGLAESGGRESHGFLTRRFYGRDVRMAIAWVGVVTALGAGGLAHGALSAPATRVPALLTFVPPKGGICAVRPDGSHGLRLTPRWRLFDGSWSADGRYVAFVRATASENMPSQVSVTDARGKIRWRFGTGHVFSPLWAPDGQHIAFLYWWAHSKGLVVARPDGSDLHAVSDSGWPPHSGPEQPAWSRDGQRLAFVYDGSIYSVRIDGSDRQLLVANGAHPAYSPDGTELAYVAHTGPGVFVANADGSDPHQVSPRAVSWEGWGPSWSPDGTLVVFRGLASSELVVARTDGSGERVIAALKGAMEMTEDPQWSPDGQLVAFTEALVGGARPSKSAVGVARADGSGWRVVVSRVAWRDIHSLAWRPAVALPAAKRATCPRR
jgi:Tol biopolymer transport system component